MLTSFLTQHLEKTYRNQPWYGPGVLESLHKLAEDQWHRPLGHRTVAGLVGHIIAWRKFAADRLQDGQEYLIEMNTPSDWPDCSARSKANLLLELADTQTLLLVALHSLTDEQLPEKVPASYEYSRGDLALGILQHDIYHIGQINLIVSLLAEQEKKELS